MKNIFKVVSVVCLMILIASAISWGGYQTLVYMKMGGDEQVVASGGQVTVESGGEIEIESGGTIDVESGGALKIAGTQMTSSAAELNFNDGATAGTAVASKALVLDSSKRFIGTLAYIDSSHADGDTLTVADYGKILLHINSIKKTWVLPLAAAGGHLAFIVDDGDSLVLDANASDKIINGSDEFEKMTTDAGVIEMWAVNARDWYMKATGTMTGY